MEEENVLSLVKGELSIFAKFLRYSMRVYSLEEGTKLLHDVTTVSELRNFLLNGARIDELNHFDETPLLCALRRDSDIELIQELITQGANVNARDCWGVTPLYCAVARHGRKNLEIVKMLLDSGADIKSGKRENDRFLDHTVTHNTSCAELVIKYKFLKNSNLLKNVVLHVHNSIDEAYYEYYKQVVDLDLMPSSYGFLSKYLDSCANEVHHMKSVFVNDASTLLDFIKDKFFMSSMSNERSAILVDIILRDILKFNYIVYKDTIASQLGRENLMRFLEKQLTVVKSISDPFKNTIFNLDLLYCMSKYLSEMDLMNIIIALNM